MSDDVSGAFQFTIAVVNTMLWDTRSRSLCADLRDTLCRTARHMVVIIHMQKAKSCHSFTPRWRDQNWSSAWLRNCGRARSWIEVLEIQFTLFGALQRKWFRRGCLSPYNGSRSTETSATSSFEASNCANDIYSHRPQTFSIERPTKSEEG